MFKMEHIFEKGQMVEKVATIIEDFTCSSVITLGTMPSHLSVSADDSTLAVCHKRSGSVFASMYDIKMFADDAEMVRD